MTRTTIARRVAVSAAATVAVLAAGACTEQAPPAVLPSVTTTSQAASRPTPAALPTAGQKVLASASGTGTDSLGPVAGADGLRVLVSCVGTSVEISVKQSFTVTHDCEDGSASSYEGGPRKGTLAVNVTAAAGTRWRVAVLPGS